MFFGVLAEVFQFILQFDDRFFEIELMFHGIQLIADFKY
jgi:hypothetical protein